MQTNMTSFERRAALSLASIFSFRMLGLFMIMPIFSLYAHQLKGSTPFLIGVALGIYGLTQACLQIPFGMLSDRVGRKRIIAIGLGIFVIGSIVAALSHTMWGMILGRALQGGGAVGSSIMALVADTTREEHRTKAMAIIGMTIGMSFSVALILGPLLSHSLGGLNGLFWLTAILGTVGIIMLFATVPNPKQSVFHRDTGTEPAQFFKTLFNIDLFRLNCSIFLQHAILVCTFIALPIILVDKVDLTVMHQWKLYLPILIGAFIVSIPFIIISEKKRCLKGMLLAAVLVLGVSQLTLWEFHSHLWSVAISLFFFFSAFSLLEASLPSLVSKTAPAKGKGTALGIYSSIQFLGIFFGGVMGGWLYKSHGILSLFLFSLLLAVIWLVIVAGMKKPRYVSTRLFKLSPLTADKASELTRELQTIEGVVEAEATADDGVAYLKVDRKVLNEATLDKCLSAYLDEDS